MTRVFSMFAVALPRSRSRLAAALLAATLALPAAPRPAFAQVNLPALGDSTSADFGIGVERRLGDQIMRDIRRDPDYIDDPILEDYLQSIWQPLLAASRQRGNIAPDEDERFAWQPFLVRDRGVNAFALPGGYVGVNLGMIAVTANRDELASVLAHEMSHVTQRHIARSIANSSRQGLIGMAAMILGAIAASRSTSPDALNAVVVGSQAATAQGQLNVSRDMEREADRVGFGVLTSAGFAPSGMASMFEKLATASRLNDGNSYPYLRSHPLTSERIGEARARLGAARDAAPHASNELQHAVMQARARVLMDPRAQALQRLQALDGTGPPATAPLPERVAALAASAMASSALRDAPRADAAMQRVLALVRSSALPHADAEHALRLLEVQLALDRVDAARPGAALESFSGE
jgi:predicted Zn-dependent protease